ncbi:MAG: M24 family metallopeptidase [Woeseiaceae bacterium]
MKVTKREFLAGTAACFAGNSMFAAALAASSDGDIGSLQSMTAGAVPITVSERQSRLRRATQLMNDAGMRAIVIEAGSALNYFSGIRWWRSERFTGLVLRADGQWCVITPFFEGPSIREQMQFGQDVRTWHEDEDPFALIADFVNESDVTGAIGIEETARFFIADGIRRLMPKVALVNAAPVTRGCRMIKSPAELALMQIANDVTLAAYEYVYPRVKPGMLPSEISAMMNQATSALGGTPEFSLVLLGPASAYPHGTSQPQQVRKGEAVLMDCGCHVFGYQSDISRTWFMGKAGREERRVWQTVKDGQSLALDTMRLGTPAGLIDQTVRKFYESRGFGPGYETPGLTHRLGHGIGLDGHEPINFVGNETVPLAAGMCFSNEPGIYLPGEFGVRLEDCLYMTDDGPQLFSPLSPSIDKPFG